MASSPTILSRVLIPAVPAFQGGAPLDLISLADIKLELKIASGADDVWLKDVITRQSRAVAKFCNRVFQVQTYQDQFWARREAHPWQIHGGFLPLQLAHWPIVAQISPAGSRRRARLFCGRLSAARLWPASIMSASPM
ncbi:MAG: hypothetical protein WDN46_15065 [Methylocella sp.]